MIRQVVRLRVEWRGHRKDSEIEVDRDTAEGLIRSGYALPVHRERNDAPALLQRKGKRKAEDAA